MVQQRLLDIAVDAFGKHGLEGASTREIASTLFVSENTVKTHASRLFGKLEVNRRTKAVQVAKSMRLIP